MRKMTIFSSIAFPVSLAMFVAGALYSIEALVVIGLVLSILFGSFLSGALIAWIVTR